MSDYVFCKRGWWLKLNNLLPESSEKSQVMQEGTQKHYAMTQDIKINRAVTRFALFLIAFCIFALVLYFLLWQ